MKYYFLTAWYWVTDTFWLWQNKYWYWRDRLICRFRGHVPTYAQDGSSWEPNVEVFCERCWERL